MKHIAFIKLVAATALLILSAGLVHAKEAIHFDASSDASAKASWDQMYSHASREGKRNLLAAVIQINLAGVKSVNQVVSNPDLREMSAMRIKDKIADLTAEQIIDLGNRVATVKVGEPRH